MRSLLFPLCATLLLLGLYGCTTAPSAPAKTKKLDTKPAPLATNAPAGITSSALPLPMTEAPLPEGEYRLMIESTPSELVVVVNGIPVGKTPRTIELAGTPRGFFRDQVSIKVRFISTDAAHPSQSVEELLTPLDRIPSTVKFTNAGTTRVARN